MDSLFGTFEVYKYYNVFFFFLAYCLLLNFVSLQMTGMFCKMQIAEKILHLFAETEEKAFQLLYDTYYKTLVLFANQMVNDKEVAKDIVQDYFAKFWVTKPYKTLQSGLDKYIFQAVKFSVLTYLKESRRKEDSCRAFSREVMIEENVIPMEEQVDIIKIVYQMIDLLPDERRQVFLMVFVDKMSYQEVADRLGISKNTVKTQLARALKFLRKMMKDNDIPFLFLFLVKK